MNVRDHEERGLEYGGVVILVEKLSFGSVSRADSAFFVLFFCLVCLFWLGLALEFSQCSVRIVNYVNCANWD